MERGRAVYNFRCYFCHGYNGDARTEAAAQLDPRPRVFVGAAELDLPRILDAVTNGRDGTAMRGFANVLPQSEIEDVALFVAEEFVGCERTNTRYHTAANGWPNHADRYAAAFPFATGEVPIDVPPAILRASERAALELFRTSCISCHEGRLAKDPGLSIAPAGAASHAAFDPWNPPHHDDDEYEKPTIHDVPPELAAPSEAALRGRTLYAEACSECHAMDGSGKNWIGKFLQPNPTDFTADAFAQGFDRARFAAGTLDAVLDTTMPSFRGVLSEQEAADIAAYVEEAFIRPGG